MTDRAWQTGDRAVEAHLRPEMAGVVGIVHEVVEVEGAGTELVVLKLQNDMGADFWSPAQAWKLWESVEERVARELSGRRRLTAAEAIELARGARERAVWRRMEASVREARL